MANKKIKINKLIDKNAIILLCILWCYLIFSCIKLGIQNWIWFLLTVIGMTISWFFAVAVGMTISWFFAQRIIHFIQKHNKNIKEELTRWIISDKNTPHEWKLFNRTIIPEYDIPNLLSPIEAWFLYDMKVWKPDIVCAIYKRAWMWIIKLSQKNWWLIIKKTWNIKKWQIPQYEYAFRETFFSEWNFVQFPNKLVYKKLDILKKWIEKYCIKQWRIYNENVNSVVDIKKQSKSSNEKKFIPFGRLFWLLIWLLLLFLCFLVIKKNMWLEGPTATKLGICMGLGIPFIIVYIWYYIISIKQTMNKHTLKLTEVWKELIIKIHWYKKFLENCEEKQLKQFMKEDPLYIDKVLPYAVALGLENTISSKISQNILDDNAKDIFLLEKII